MSDYDTYTINDTGETAEEFVTLLVRSRSPRPRLGAEVDPAHIPVGDSKGHSRTHLSECGRKDLEDRVRKQGRASVKAAGSPPAVRVCLCGRWFSRHCNGLRR